MEETKRFTDALKLEYIALLINTDEMNSMPFKEFKYRRMNTKNGQHVNVTMSDLLNEELMLKLVDLMIKMESELFDKKAKDGIFKMSQFIRKVHELLSQYNIHDMIRHPTLTQLLHMDKTDFVFITDMINNSNSSSGSVVTELKFDNTNLNSKIVTISMQMLQLIKECGMKRG